MHAGDGDAVRERVAHRVRARERRQQRRVGVEDPARERREHGRPDDPHVAGQDDDVGPRTGQERRRARRVVAARDERGLDPLLRRPVERRARPIGEHEDDLAAELAARGGRRQRPQVDPAPETPTAIRPLTATDSSASSGPSTYRAPPIASRLDDLADDQRLDAALGRARRWRSARPPPATTDDHAEAAVERRPQLRVVQPAERAEQAHDRRHRPARRVEARAEARPAARAARCPAARHR